MIGVIGTRMEEGGAGRGTASKLSAEEQREIRAKLNELDNEAWFDNAELI
jgi:hypothetical protein